MYENLFEPVRVAGTTIPNRVVRAAHSTGAPWVDGGDDLIAYHEARARGGVGLSILEIAGVHRTSATAIPVYDDRVIAGYEQLMARIRPHGMKVFQQLWHGGNARVIPGQAPWSASDVPNPVAGVAPRPMTQGMIDEVVASFASAARRVRDGGLDGVEIHGAHGYLVGQFLSPATNHRTDGYGGALENRTRFLREVLTAMRAEVGDDFPIGVRLSGDEEVEGGLHPEDTAAVVRGIEHLADFIDVSLGSYYRFYKFFETMGPLGYEIPTSQVVTRATTLPTIITGRIMTLEHASRIVADGTASMVSMVRTLIADPEIVVKARQGRDAETRPCIGTNQGCVGQLLMTGKLACVVNPTAGREAVTPFETPAPAPVVKRVVIVGGGPAGLEAARTAALRGHDVRLFEMTRQLGGQVAIAAAAPYRGDIGAITRWLADEVQRLGVKVHLQTPVDPDLVRAEEPDEVIIATGSTPRRDGLRVWRPAEPLPGHDRSHVYTSWDVFGFGGRATVGSRAVVYDDAGGYEAVSVAEALLERGAAVTFVTSHETMAARVNHPPSTVYPARERLLAAGVEIITTSSLGEITADDVEVLAMGGVASRRVPADTVVLVGVNTPNRELADELADAPFPVHVIGDAASGKTIQQAIAQATALVRSM